MSKKITDVETDNEAVTETTKSLFASANIEEETVMNEENKKAVIETMVYVGQTIAGVATQNTFFNNGIPDALKAVIEEVPAIGGLLIPINKLPMALKEIESKQGAMHIYIENAKQYKPKKGA